MTTINGIDLLFVVAGLLLLLLVMHIWDRYQEWAEWDRNRRHERKKQRYVFEDSLSETQYRVYLRASSTGLIAAMNRAARSLERFNEIFRGETRV